MEESTAVRALAALAQPMRLRLFRALIGAAPGGLNPSALAALFGVPASTLSFHLKELTQAGLVEVERSGRQLIYRPALPQMDALLGYLVAHCCQGAGAPAGSVPPTACLPAASCCVPSSPAEPTEPSASTEPTASAAPCPSPPRSFR